MNNGKICVSVCAATADEMIAKIKKAEQFADVIEVRFDCLDPNETFIWEQLKEFRKQFSGSLLATNRPQERGQGGKSSLSEAERTEFWRGFAFEFTDWADIEFDLDLGDSRQYVRAVWQRIVWSFHAFGVVPNESNLTNLYLRLAGNSIDRREDKDPDVVKIAIRTDDIVDAIPVWKLLARTKADQKIIPIAMGDAGKWTRILGLAHGAFMTYSSLESGDETAPGQVTARDLVEVYRVKDLDKNTQVFGVIGDPVEQSLSPYMHNPAFVDRGVNAVFLSLLVKDLDQFMRRMVMPDTREVELNFGGFSVTMPHKRAIMLHLDAIDPTANAIGAVNTVKITDGKLTGYNTDAHGFMTPLKDKFGDLRDAKVAVFGAGGAARACVYGLKQEGAEVTVFARDAAKGKAFADEFGVIFSEISNLKSESSKSKSEVSDIKFEISNDQGQMPEGQRPEAKDQRPRTILSGFDILVDATPLGMKGPYENDSLFTGEEMAGLKFVYDLVTKTTDPPLIAEAKRAGIPAIGGLEMLIAQGCMQFEIWTGCLAPAELMRDSLVARMPK